MLCNQTAIQLQGVAKILSGDIDKARNATFLRMMAGPWRNRVGLRPGEFWLLEDISFTINRGEKVVVLGESKSGKSTLLRLLAGLSVPSRGEIQCRGLVRQVQTKSTIGRPLMPLHQYICSLISLMGGKWGTIRSTADAILESCALSHRANVRYRDLTAEELKRVTYFTSLTVPADIYLFDEPTFGIFPDLEKQVLENGTAVVFARRSTGLPEVFSRGIVLHDGKIAFDGAVEGAMRKLCVLPLPSRALPTAPSQPPGSADDEDMAVENGEEPTPDLPARRRGSGKVRVTRVYFINNRGEQTPTLPTGEPVRVVLHYQAVKGVTGKFSNVTILFEDERCRRVFSCQSEVGNFELGMVQSQGELACEIKQLPLLPGRFGLTASVHIDGELADKLVNDYYLEVTAADVYETGRIPIREQGVVWVPYVWSTTQDRTL